LNDLTLTLSQRLVSLGLSALVQATIILALGLLAGRITQKRGPAWQSLAYRAALATTFLSVVVTLLAGGHIPERVSFSTRIAPAVSRPDRFVKTIHPPITIEDVGGGESAVPGPLPVQPSHVHMVQSRRGSPPSDWPWILAGALWLGGAIIVGVRSIAGSVALFHLRRTATTIVAGPAVEIAAELSAQLKTASPPLRTHRKVRGPFLAGLCRPAIYLPADYPEQYDASTLRAVLSHELAHMIRKDCGWLAFQQLLSTIFWFHPLYHAASSRLLQAAEEACDAIVVSLDCPAQEYAASLLALAERSRNHREPAHALGVTPIRSSVGKRIRLILDRSRRAVVRVPAWGLTVAGLTVISLAGLAIAVFCPAEAGWRLAAQASVAGVTPPVSWTPDHDYASHFRLAREHGWSMAPARGIALIDRPNGFENSVPTAIPQSDLTLMKACRSTWSVDMNGDRYLSPDRAPLLLRDRIEKVLANHPHYFYAEYRLAIWYASHRDFEQYRVWRDRALADAPAIMAGRVQYDDGRPVVGMEYSPFFLYRATDSDHESDFSPTPEDIAITDEDGCYYVPVYRALYDDLGSTVDGPSDPVFTTLKKNSVMTRQYLHRIVIDR
jgi:beta-lactamase regulating signal transducer with metallopeptidase domain